MKRKLLLTEEYQAKLLAMLRQSYGRYLGDGERFELTHQEIAADAWTLSVTFENSDRSLHVPLELALVQAENPRLTNDEARDLLIDFLGYFFDRYFKAERQVTLPLDYRAFPFGAYSIRARGWEKNLKLEHAADRILAGEPPEEVLP